MKRDKAIGKKKSKKKGLVWIALVLAILACIVGCGVAANYYGIDFERIKISFSNSGSQDDSTSAGIPFSEILAKISEEAEFSGEIIPDMEATHVEVEDGKLEVRCTLNQGEALIFDRDALVLPENKKPDEFIIGEYCSSGVSHNKNSIYCEEAESVARVLRYNSETEELFLLWENTAVFYDLYLPINAIGNVQKFAGGVKPLATMELYDEKKLRVESFTETEQETINSSVYFEQRIPDGCVAIIQCGENYYVISQNYKDTEITNIEENKFVISQQTIIRILIYDYQNNLIELIYNN